MTFTADRSVSNEHHIQPTHYGHNKHNKHNTTNTTAR